MHGQIWLHIFPWPNSINNEQLKLKVIVKKQCILYLFRSRLLLISSISHLPLTLPYHAITWPPTYQIQHAIRWLIYSLDRKLTPPSCNMALISLVEEWEWVGSWLQQLFISVAVLLDLSKILNVVNHNISLPKLEMADKYNCRGRVLFPSDS